MGVTGVTMITGVARHSLGEVFVTQYLTRNMGGRLVGVDRVPNAHLSDIPRYVGLQVDLNPLSRAGYLEEFGSELRESVMRILDALGTDGIHSLIQSAGVYDSGPFLDHDSKRRQRIIGVNSVGHVEVLYQIMTLNSARGIDNGKLLTYIDIGSFQGFYARAQRPLYAPSKAAGIDFCTALWEGREVRRCIYFAPALIDTHMVHENHWIKKAGGSVEFFRYILDGPVDRYRAIFIKCDVTVLREAASVLGIDLEKTLQTFDRYRSIRQEAFEGNPGVLGVNECAGMLVKIAIEPDQYPSGVYFANSMPGEGPALWHTSFSELSRRDLFERVARRLL